MNSKNTSAISTLPEDHEAIFFYPSETDKRSFMTWAYGGTFITPWVNSFRNQLAINKLHWNL